MLDIAKALAYLASQSPRNIDRKHSALVHNDVRSPNVFLVSLAEDAAVHAKLGDYGPARFAAGKLQMGLQSWQYLAPEVLDPRSAGFDVRADVCAICF